MHIPFTGPHIEHTQLVDAIRAAERRTSGEIRVVIAREKTSDPVASAKQHFERLGMTQTAERNGVLIFVAPASHTFAVIGDTGIHEKCGDTFWHHLAEQMTERFRQGEFTAGLTLAIQRAGALLAAHFPAKPGDRNELSDDIEEA